MVFNHHPIKITFLFAVLLFSCMDGTSKAQENQTSSNDVDTHLTSNAQADQSAVGNTISQANQDNRKQLKYFYIIYPNDGVAMSRIPFPATWEQHKKSEYEFTGPNGIKVYTESGRYFSYSNDPMMMELYQATGVNVKYPMDMEQSINEIMVPIANTKNMKLVKKYPVPSLMEGFKNFAEMLYRKEQSSRQYNSSAIEWVQPDGTQWITVYHYSIEQNQNNISWGFTANTMGAPPQYFQQAKQDYLNGLLNKQLNPQWIRIKNLQSQMAVEAIDAETERRTAQWRRMMADRKQQWDAYQENYKNKQAQTARQNEMVSDAILGKVNIIDPDSGVKTKIENTNTHYWVNSQNKYIGTDKSYEDPNKNAFLNGETWREFKIDDYRN